VVELDQLHAAAVEAEAAERGFTARERIDVPPTMDHVGSTVLVMEAA
jgi:hypothetical protein